MAKRWMIFLFGLGLSIGSGAAESATPDQAPPPIAKDSFSCSFDLVPEIKAAFPFSFTRESAAGKIETAGLVGVTCFARPVDLLIGADLGAWSLLPQADFYALQCSLFNQARGNHFLQIALCNQAAANRGVQVAGFNQAAVNQGVQLGAFPNHARENQGLQLGVLNVSDLSNAGLQAGVINGDHALTGLQLGVFNGCVPPPALSQPEPVDPAEEVALLEESGCQIGVFNLNLTENSLWQFGLLNYNPNGWLKFTVFVNRN